MCSLAHDFNLQIHDAIATRNRLRFDGSTGKQPQKDHGRSVNCFTEKSRKARECSG